MITKWRTTILRRQFSTDFILCRLALMAAVSFIFFDVFGCAVGPNFKRPDPPGVSNYTRETLTSVSGAGTLPGGTKQR
jgi:hypothetical protein